MTATLKLAMQVRENTPWAPGNTFSSQFTRWDKGLSDSTSRLPLSSYPVCAYLFPNQWAVVPVPSSAQTTVVKAAGNKPGAAGAKMDSSSSRSEFQHVFGGVVCKAPAAPSTGVQQATDLRLSENSDSMNLYTFAYRKFLERTNLILYHLKGLQNKTL
jgi:hypothetical protein